MNHNRFRAAFGAAAITATLLASGAGVSAATAATTGDHGPSASHGGKDEDGDKGDKAKNKNKNKGKDKGGDGSDKASKKLAKAVAKQDARFVRLLDRVEKKLDDADSAAVVANIEADRQLLAGLTSRAQVRDLQPENYEQVIAWLRKLERLVAEVETLDTTEAASAVAEQLHAITAISDKADLHAAKRLLGELKDVVDAAVEDGDDAGDGDEPTDEPTDDSTDDSTDEPTDEGGTDTGA